jgi:hypothetical protein
MKFSKLLKFKNKIGYFDILLGVAFLVIVFVFYLFFYRKVQYVNIRVKVTDQNVLYAGTNPKTWYANRFEVGDSELDELGNVISKITNIKSFNMSADSKAVYLDIKIKAVYDRRTQLYSAKGTNLSFGNVIKFNFPNVTFSGLVTESPNTINQKDLVIEKKRVTLLQRGGFEPQVLEKIQKGDKITDSEGNVLLEVIDTVVKPAQQITQNDQGDLLIKYNPYYKDMVITTDVAIKKYRGDDFAFDNIPLRLGYSLPLNFSYTSIWPIIVDIK